MIALDSIPLIVVAIAAATLVRDLFFFCVELVAGMPPALLTHYTHMSLWNALLTAAAGDRHYSGLDAPGAGVFDKDAKR